MDDVIDRPKDEFSAVAAGKAKVTLDIDYDIADYFMSQFQNWQGHANDLLRFFMETSQAKELEFEGIEQPEPEDQITTPLPPAP
jgi:hypothetical protein